MLAKDKLQLVQIEKDCGSEHQAAANDKVDECFT